MGRRECQLFEISLRPFLALAVPQQIRYGFKSCVNSVKPFAPTFEKAEKNSEPKLFFSKN